MLGYGRRARGVQWVTEDSNLNVSGARKTATRKLFWGTEDSDPDVPGSRKTATRMFRGHGRQRPGIILGHGRPPRPECTWGTEDRDPDIPGARKTTTKLDGGTGGVAKLNCDRARRIRC